MNNFKKYIALSAIIFGLTAMTVNHFEKSIENQENDIFQKHHSESSLKNTDSHTNKENSQKNHIATSYNKKHVTAFASKIKEWLHDLPLPQDKVHSIMGANTPAARKALQNFSRQISTKIISNNSLTKEEQNRILWEAFINIDWPGKDNAFRSTIQDYLTGNNPFQIANELRTTYQTLSASSGNFETLHALLEITDSIIKIDVNTLESQEAQQYNSSLASVKSLLLDQIRTIPKNSQAKDLTSFAIDLYFSRATTNEIEFLISTINIISSSNPEIALQLYHSTWKNALSRPSDSTKSTNFLLTHKSPQSNQALVFLLKEDGNIVISNVPANTRKILLTHLQSLEASPEISADKKASIDQLKNLQ